MAAAASDAGPRETADKASEPVLVIGAGPAGLAAAAELRQLGVPAEVLERNDSVASSWRGRYDRLRLNTCRWTSTLSRQRYPPGTPLFPARDDLVRYLESYTARYDLTVRFGVQVDRIDRGAGGWRLATPGGERTARQVIVAIGYQHTPRLPDWPGHDRFPGRLLHAAHYRNPADFRGADVLVVGAGCSALEIAYDLAQGEAGRVRVAVRTQPNIMLRSSGGVPGDVPATALLRLPPRVADRIAGFVRRRTIGDLAPWGLTPPDEGLFTRQRRDDKVPAIVDMPVIAAIRSGDIGIVAPVDSVGADGVRLADGTAFWPDAIIAATGYGTGLEPLAGHLGVLDAGGRPLAHGGPPAAPGLRFLGYVARPGQIGIMGREARRAAREVSTELAA
jgi:cation diffusion facilitator CzcD-associated flavoprotein CzcO